MPSKSLSLLETVLDIIDRRGKSALEEATWHIMQDFADGSIVSEALQYYAKVTFPRVLPIFPALIHISCEAVGGKPERTKCIATAMMLITASGDIHDDIIDRSTHKFGQKTMFGKFGKDITLLAGDALLFQGMALLQRNEASLEERAAISDLITKAMIELTAAEATETCLWKKDPINVDEYFEVIRHKGSVAELHCGIGGILGGADKEALENITKYGRAIGILSTMKDEFMDVTNFSEIKSRVKNEVLPYPFICAFQDAEIGNKILPIVKNGDLSRKELPFVSETILKSPEVKQLKDKLKGMGEQELSRNPLLTDCKRGKEAALLLQFLASEL
jgi:geranylgeranyl pyrophosphate synthase